MDRIFYINRDNIILYEVDTSWRPTMISFAGLYFCIEWTRQLMHRYDNIIDTNDRCCQSSDDAVGTDAILHENRIETERIELCVPSIKPQHHFAIIYVFLQLTNRRACDSCICVPRGYETVMNNNSHHLSASVSSNRKLLVSNACPVRTKYTVHRALL